MSAVAEPEEHPEFQLAKRDSVAEFVPAVVGPVPAVVGFEFAIGVPLNRKVPVVTGSSLAI